MIIPNLGDSTIYHIGSTAIAGSIAKPIIDIAIAYNEHSAPPPMITGEMLQ
ncbi:GrpB family protein [Photobacterium japonica]|uniref:GrpB family protein n=1 Tax=Photobacterium japonica TaxID=2910235 RepID=UPI003D0EE4E6